MRNERERLKMLKDVNVLSVEEVSEYVVVSSDVFEVSGVYKMMLDDDCKVLSCELVEESEVMSKECVLSLIHISEPTRPY